MFTAICMMDQLIEKFTFIFYNTSGIVVESENRDLYHIKSTLLLGVQISSHYTRIWFMHSFIIYFYGNNGDK